MVDDVFSHHYFLSYFISCKGIKNMRAKCYDCGDKTRTKTYTPEWSFMYIASEIRQLCPEHTKIRQEERLKKQSKYLSARSRRRECGD